MDMRWSLAICLTMTLVLGFRGEVHGEEKVRSGANVPCRLDSTTGGSLVCANVWVAPTLVDAFELALERSPAFRRLLTIVQRHDRLHASIVAVARCEARSQRCGARTTFRRFGTQFSIAVIEVEQAPELGALLAHELAHVGQWITGHLRRATADSYHLEEEASAASERVWREISSADVNAIAQRAR